MPFKTRRAKIAAARRRFTIVRETTMSYPSALGKTAGQEQNVSQQTDNEPATETKKSSLQIESSYQYLRSDLLRIVLLAGVISTAQIILLVILK